MTGSTWRIEGINKKIDEYQPAELRQDHVSQFGKLQFTVRGLGKQPLETRVECSVTEFREFVRRVEDMLLRSPWDDVTFDENGYPRTPAPIQIGSPTHDHSTSRS